MARAAADKISIHLWLLYHAHQGLHPTHNSAATLPAAVASTLSAAQAAAAAAMHHPPLQAQPTLLQQQHLLLGLSCGTLAAASSSSTVSFSTQLAAAPAKAADRVQGWWRPSGKGLSGGTAVAAQGAA